MSQSTQRILLNKGYTEQGFAEKVFHLHIRVVGDNDELYFRDYLRENHNVAKEYEHLKLNLWKKFEHDRDGYTDAKREFVKRYTKVAKEKSRLNKTKKLHHHKIQVLSGLPSKSISIKHE